MVLTTPIICILTRVRTNIPVVRYGIPGSGILHTIFSRHMHSRFMYSVTLVIVDDAWMGAIETSHPIALVAEAIERAAVAWNRRS